MDLLESRYPEVALASQFTTKSRPSSAESFDSLNSPIPPRRKPTSGATATAATAANDFVLLPRRLYERKPASDTYLTNSSDSFSRSFLEREEFGTQNPMAKGFMDNVSIRRAPAVNFLGPAVIGQILMFSSCPTPNSLWKIQILTSNGHHG